MPEWSADEEALARALQTKANVKVDGLKREITPLSGSKTPRTSANDAGDISWKVPMAKFYYPSNVPNINFHHWAGGVTLAHSIAHKGAVAGSKAFAAAVVECFANPARARGGQAHLQGRSSAASNTSRCCRRSRSRRSRSTARSWKNSARRCASTI